LQIHQCVSMLRKHNILLTSEILVQILFRKDVERSFGSCLLRYPFGEIDGGRISEFSGGKRKAESDTDVHSKCENY
jgi:hypothetical protein